MICCKFFCSDRNWLNFPTNHGVPYQVSRYQSYSPVTRPSSKLPVGTFINQCAKHQFMDIRQPIATSELNTLLRSRLAQQVRPRTRQWNLRWLPSCPAQHLPFLILNCASFLFAAVYTVRSSNIILKLIFRIRNLLYNFLYIELWYDEVVCNDPPPV